MKTSRGLIACAASIIALSLALAPMLAQAQMSGSSGCGQMDSMGYGQTSPHAGWAIQPSAHEHVSPQPVQVKSGMRGHGAKKKDHRGHSGPAGAGQGEHAGPAPEHVNQTAPPVM